jgi:hypothetical protein
MIFPKVLQLFGVVHKGADAIAAAAGGRSNREGLPVGSPSLIEVPEL